MNDLTLRLGGKPYPLGIYRFRLQQRMNDIPALTLELAIPTDNNRGMDDALKQDSSAFDLGTPLEIYQNKTALFKGYLLRKQIHLQGKIWSVVLEARHALQKLTLSPHNRVFQQQDDNTVLKTLLQGAGIKLTQRATTQLSSKQDQLIQFRVSDWQFIRSRLLSTNCWLLGDAVSDSATISPLAVAAAAEQTLERDGGKYSLYEINLHFDNRYTLASLSLQGWDVAQQQLTPEQKTQANTFKPWQPTVMPTQFADWQQNTAIAFSHLPEASLNTLANAWVNYRQLTTLQGNILLAGTHDFSVGQSIKLHGFGSSMDGTALVSGISQLFTSEQGWRTELSLGMPPSLFEPIPPVRSLHIGIAAEYAADPQHLDRLAIHLPALQLPGVTLYARLSKPWASKASGFCFYPEPGDELIVGFIENDPRYPIILGALHNPVNVAPFPPDEKNNRKALVVNKADKTHALTMDIEKDTLTLAQQKNTLTLAEETGVAIDTTTTLQFKAQTLKQQADSASIEAKQQVEITSANINMKK